VAVLLSTARVSNDPPCFCHARCGDPCATVEDQSLWEAGAAKAINSRERCHTNGRRTLMARTSGSAMAWVFDALNMLRVVMALRGHARMLAVAQRTPWVLVLQALGCSVGDAISVGGRRRKCSARDSGADGAFEASGIPSSRLAMRGHAQLLANAGAHRAAAVLVLL